MKIKLLSQNCFLASHPLVLPYFVRSTLIKHQVHSDLFSQELLVASKAPLSEFARRVNERALPGEFYSVEAAGLAGVKCLMEVKDFTGEFMDTRCLHDLSQDTTWFKHATLYSLPLSRQPNSPYPRMPLENEGKDAFAEARYLLDYLNVEVPTDFDFRVCTGTLRGYQAEVIAKCNTVASH